MYIIAIAWVYTVLMVSAAQPTLFRGIVTFVGAGLMPLALFLYLFGTPQRRRNQAARERERERLRANAETGTTLQDSGDRSESTRHPSE
jgi:hypothetical protein